MEVNKILEAAFANLGREDIFSGEENESKELKKMLRCFNWVINEIATEYFSPEATQIFCTEDGVIPLSSFSQNFLRAVRVENAEGAVLRFKTSSGNLMTEEGVVKIIYQFIPAAIQFGETFVFLDGKITERVIAYGVAMEFAYVSGNFEDAMIWEKRYKDSLLSLARQRKEKKWKKRRWNA